MRKGRARLTGVLLLLGSIGSTAMHRYVHELTRGGPAQLSELALCLLTIVLASTGTVLMFSGARFVAGRRTRPPPRNNAAHGRRDRTIQRLLADASPDGVLLDTRDGVALVVAHRAMAIAAKRLDGARRLSARAGGVGWRNAMRGRS